MTFGIMRGILARRNARRRKSVPGITVVTVNWNTLSYLRVLIDFVKARSPQGLRLVVVDNASSDGSREFLHKRDDVHSIFLNVNIRHGLALDLGVAAARTEFVVALDVDAFPIHAGWLSPSIRALEEGYHLSGACFHRNFIHPCFLVARHDMIIMNDLSFRPLGQHPRKDGSFNYFFDVGEALSQAVIVKYGSKSLHRIEPTETRGPGMAGTVFGGSVYHNFYTTYGDQRQGSLQLFKEAVERFKLD